MDPSARMYRDLKLKSSYSTGPILDRLITRLFAQCLILARKHWRALLVTVTLAFPVLNYMALERVGPCVWLKAPHAVKPVLIGFWRVRQCQWVYICQVEKMLHTKPSSTDIHDPIACVIINMAKHGIVRSEVVSTNGASVRLTLLRRWVSLRFFSVRLWRGLSRFLLVFSCWAGSFGRTRIVL